MSFDIRRPGRRLPLLHHVEAAVAANLVDAHQDAVAFALGVFVELAFDRAPHDLLADVAVLVDRRRAVEAPTQAVFFVIEEHADMGVLFQVSRAGAEGAVPEGDMLIVENKRAAAKAHVGKAVVRGGRPDAVFLFFESLVDSLLHFLGDLDHVASPQLQYFLWGSVAAVKRFCQRCRES